MSTLKANNLDTESGTTITVAAGKTLAGTDIIGSTQIADAAVSNAKLSNMAANTVKVRDANSSGVPTDKAVATTEILIGDGTGFTAAALSSDVTMANTGAVTIANNAVSLAKMAGLARGSIIYGDASGDPAALAKGTADQVLKSDGTDIAWGADSGGLFSSYALCSDQVTQNTVGQGITSGAWRVRNINTEIADPDGIVSLSSNRFSLAAGSYAIKAFITAYHGNAQLVRLYDYTNSAVVVYGQTTYLDAVHNFTMTLVVMGRVTPSGTTEYEIQHQLASTIGQLPAAASNYGTEGYLFLEIYKES